MDKHKAMEEITQILSLYAAEMAREDLSRYGSDSRELKSTLRHYLEIAQILDIEKGFLEWMKLFSFNVEYFLKE